MTDQTWKAAERAIARYFNGRRRGADFRGESGGKTDIVCPGWAVEVKHSKRPTFGLMRDAVSQAEANREHPEDIPLAVIHQAGTEYRNALVVLRLETFREHFINVCAQKG